MALPDACPGQRRTFDSPVGRLTYYSAGPAGASQLLLIHSINAAASAYEMRPLFERFSATRRVYALDLPGFGASERRDRSYTPQLMTDAILAMAGEVAGIEGGVALDAMALSLSCEFLARAAALRPGAFRTLGLISPTGFNRPRPQRARGDLGMPWLHATLAAPLWRQALYRGLTSRPSIRFFLQKTWGSKQIDEGLLEYDWLCARQPGAEHAPLYFLSGHLFATDVLAVYRHVQAPVWATHGVRGDFTDYRLLPPLAKEKGWRVLVLPTGALPHFERLGELATDYEGFLDALSA